uniref:RIB43A-like with coiled-coils protein 2 n=1 Tax=Hemiselmis andersenii TaxID=464988 RepID=A0A6T8GEW3_HEMAN|mmetsp:Transcript_39217/g.91618  ORF Transcript_39217/g.91618 Transcript_39217/m.91618 type:complete len:387 (+) Transcript_39217:56-1216(+)|eukprot:CAMPEP_0114126212 /NCGR_PEP_ID=MMETSP0043_2-20121206/9710_1 /TAXON_ID=464988 /ORGANISM="Hemiselmis andersenii, Strain CCMP644" /LENGTH=386 /DNA_ID=CAMNT_0001219183 /DNA_START=62 /DNA_END=1222 /DNA_ORIENTATION=+
MATIGGVMSTSGDVSREQQESRIIDRRRRLEEERKHRIFNAKQRTIGIDRQALEQQHAEKVAARELEASRNAAFADRMLVTEQRVQLLERDVQRARKESTQSVQAYREQMQQKHMRKEWDLNDPNTLRKDRPARLGNDDPLCGPASIQKFGGEDLEYGNRVRRQQQQQAQWVVEQMAEKQAQIDNEIEMDRLFAERQGEIDERRAAMEENELASRVVMNTAVRDYNVALIDAKRQRDAQNRTEEAVDAIEEIRYQLNSNLLNEEPGATSSEGDGRTLKYAFKGFTNEQIMAIRQEQLRQAAEKQEHRVREKEAEEGWDIVQEAVRRNLIAGEREVMRRKQEIARQTAEEQKRQADEARARKEVLYKQVYAGAIDDTFFLQFGTSSR